MADPTLLALVGRFADAAGRPEAASDLAKLLHVDTLRLFIRDADLGTFVPAPGFPQANPPADWQAFLSKTIERGYCTAELTSLEGNGKQRVDGRAIPPDAVVILIGGPADKSVLGAVLSVMPLVAALVIEEYGTHAGSSAESNALERSLVASRAQLKEANRELKAKTREAERARSLAEDANRAKTDFLSTMSHELRTPLNAIGGYASLLELGIGGPVSERQLEYLRRLKSSQAHLSTLISDVLNFARVDAGHLEYHTTVVDVGAELVKLGGLIEPQAAARRITYTYSPPATPIEARADRDKLTQIVLNLLTNAVKYTPPGGTVAMTGDQRDDVVNVRVCDTGPGIPGDQRESIFEPFVQLQRRLGPDAEGVGLGLAISRDLARAMGGDLTVADAGERGSIFTLSLPAAVE
jgi:signal transduction histidine kinase